MTLQSVIASMEKHCNNYFNSRNDPADPIREYPPEFLELADRIFAYRTDEANAPSSLVAESVVGLHSWQAAKTAGGLPASWQQIFAADLSVYRRVRLI